MSERPINTSIDDGGTSRHASPSPRDLILTCELSPGDILMMTAAVRDLHLAHPGRFRTDVRTSAGAIWENNPYITPLDASDPSVRTIAMRYDLIHQSNQGAYHFIHGYVRHLEDELGVRIPLTKFQGDIHLSDQEKAWMNQVQEEPIGWRGDFWIIVAGGKYDFTAKWWDPARYQQVVDHFRGRIQFVQCGEARHWHPRLNGVIDLVGKTDLRQFIRLMYHAAGVVSPVTFAMHLAAAVEVRPGYPKNRACVVVAGGREPSQWEKYGHHRFLETNGALLCCDQGGCWKSRCQTVGDGDEKDAPENLCLLPVQLSPDLRIPRCMDLIGADDVIRAIELYHRGGAYRYLDGRETTGADAPDRPLPPRTAFLTVTDDRFFVGTLAAVNSILHYHPDAEILVVNRTDAGLNDHQRHLLERANVRVLDSDLFRAEGRHIGPWELKAYAARDLAPRYDLLIGIDSDCVLCAGVGDVAHRALETGLFTGGQDGSGVTYDESYAPYGIPPGAYNPHYMSTSLYFCPTTPENREILDRWARCTNEAVYNHRGPYPGYGDQGVLNSVIFARRGADGTDMLENETWSQHGTYWDSILVHDGDRIVNRTRQDAEAAELALRRDREVLGGLAPRPHPHDPPRAVAELRLVALPALVRHLPRLVDRPGPLSARGRPAPLPGSREFLRDDPPFLAGIDSAFRRLLRSARPARRRAAGPDDSRPEDGGQDRRRPGPPAGGPRRRGGLGRRSIDRPARPLVPGSRRHVLPRRSLRFGRHSPLRRPIRIVTGALRRSRAEALPVPLDQSGLRTPTGSGRGVRRS